MKTCLFLIMLFLPFSARAGVQHWASFKTAEGTEYKEVDLKEVTAKGIRVTHKNGSGLIPLASLPPDLRERFEKEVAAVAAARDATEKKTAGTKERRAAAEDRAKAEAVPAALSLTCQGVKETGGDGGFLGAGRFRYFVTLQNNGPAAVTGKLKVSTVNGEGVVNLGETFELTIPSGGNRGGFFNMHTAPPVRHGDAGVVSLKWTFSREGGETSTGTCQVPDRITPN